VFRSVYFR